MESLKKESSFKADFAIDLNKLLYNQSEMIESLKAWTKGIPTVKTQSRSQAWRIELQYKLYRIFQGLKNYTGPSDLATVKMAVAADLKQGRDFCCDSIMVAADKSLKNANPTEQVALEREERGIQGENIANQVNYILYRERSNILAIATQEAFDRATKVTSVEEARNLICSSQRERIKPGWLQAKKIKGEQISFTKVTWNAYAALMGVYQTDSKYKNLCLEIDRDRLLGSSDKSYNINMLSVIPLENYWKTWCHYS